jgi:hypothetical protein
VNGITKVRTDTDTIVADADYFRIKARQCFRLARQAADDGAAENLRDIARSFERRAVNLVESGRRFG